MEATRTALAGAVIIALAACGQEVTEVEMNVDDAKTMTAQGEFSALDGDSMDVAQLAANVLADELGIPLRDITVDTVRAVEWPDSSIGCPQPEQAYMQVITPGHKITLRVGNAMHIVHEANGRAFICKMRKAPERMTGQIDLVWGQQALLARKDLAGTSRRRREPDIMVGGADETTFTDSSLGCPEPGIEYEQGNRDGFVLTLRHGSRDYTYHTDLENTIPCPGISND